MAARKFLTNVDLTKLELQNAVIHTSAADIGTPTEGQLYYNTGTKELRVYNGTTWDAVGSIVDALAYKGAIDASTNPNYPAADAGDFYNISVAGKVGGASGTVVEIGDQIYCKTDSTAAGTETAVGAQWEVIQANQVAATETVAGFLELATQAETNTGTNDVTAVTPLKLKTNIATYRYNQTIGNAALKTFTINHALGTEMVFVVVFDDTTKEEVETEVVHTDANNVEITVQGVAPTLNQYRVAVIS